MTQPWLAELSLCVITDSSHNFWKVSVFNDPLVLRERHSTYWKDSLNSSKCTWRQWLPSLPWALSATSTEAYLTMVWKWATSYFCLCTWASPPPPPPPHSTPSTPAAAQTLGGNITTWKTLLTSTYSIPPSFQSRGQESLLSSLPRIDRPPARAGGQGTDLGQLYHSPALLPQESSLISPGFISSVLMQEYNKFFMWFLKCLKYVKNTDPPNTVVTSHMCLLSPESMVNPSGDEW